MIQYLDPVRKLTPQFLSYQFKDQDGVIIPLTAYVSVSLKVKVQGTAYSGPLPATFDSKPAGTVNATYSFPTAGTWLAQFSCVDGSGNTLDGEPVMVTVVKNVEDLAADDLLDY